jgi:hypothetical protein
VQSVFFLFLLNSQDALHIYTTLEATTKIKQLQVMLQNTTASENNPVAVQNSFLDVIALASHGLTTHYRDLLAIADTETRDKRLHEFQGPFDAIVTFLFLF